MEEDSLQVFPVVVTSLEIPSLPAPGTRFPVSPQGSEAKPTSGLRCSFCDHYFTEFGTHSTSSVVQAQVSPDGFEQKRWGGGELVWQCIRCKKLKRSITKEGKKLITPRVPEATVEDVKRRISNSVFAKVAGTKW
jgi:ubiquitin C-terminal hydrolase